MVSTTRAYAYSRRLGMNLRCNPCPELPQALEDDPYVAPAMDPAPWFDALVPASASLVGFVGLGVDGLDRAPVSRSPVPLLTDGSLLGPLRRPHREITFTVLILGLDEAAMSYGISWLASALRGSLCVGQSCGGDTLCMFSSCPLVTPGKGNLGDSELRMLYDVGLLEGPSVLEKTKLNRGLMATVQFTLVAGTPYIYQLPLAVTPDTPESWLPIGRDGTAIVDPKGPDPELCQPAADCLDDPECPKAPLPPLPPAPTDPCFPTDPYEARRTVVTIPPSQMPDWQEVVPVITVRTGAKVARRLTVRFHVNPAGLDCTGPIDPCASCADISAAYLPSGSELVVDGRVQRAYVDCGGGGTAEPVLYGPGGELFEWPVFECSTGLCIEIMADSGQIADDATAQVLLVAREDAA
ncbi:hypothetical protein [Streptomyces sp. TR02-1]|uniref:hypothetical protein n=1 Tax=Streptomyces sp. TR02-1 TaxID=3385977 RepID=UPI00399FE456